MRTAWRELRRRPGRFAVATGALTLLVVLLLFLGALLDGLYLGSTGAIRAQDADVFVYSADARDSFLRSRITPELRATVAGVDGVAATGGMGVALVAGRVPGEEDLADTAVIGYELPNDAVPEPPAPGSAWADRRLEADGVEVGDTLAVGPAGTPIEVAGWVEDSGYLLQGSLWVEPDTWRQVQRESRPDAAVGDGVFQVVLVQAGPGVDAAALARRIDAATGGATKSLTRAEAVLSLPGTRQQNSTFRSIIFTTFAVGGLVIALFFALLVLEHTALYGVLKAIGASSRQLVAGVVTQAIAVAAIGYALGALLTALLASAIPPEVPVQFERSRAVSTAVGIVVAAVLGAVVSLRRVVRVDPASAIGGAQ